MLRSLALVGWSMVVIFGVGVTPAAEPRKPTRVEATDDSKAPAKPAQSKPAEAKPAEKPAVDKPAESKPAGSHPEDGKPAADPHHGKPSDAKTAVTEKKPDPAKDEEYYELYKVFAETMFQVEQNYVKDVDRRKLMEAAIRGVLGELDPYSNFISPDEIDRFKTSVESQFGGIGIQISMEDGQLRVLSPIVGSPAYLAGLEAGDAIVEIDGKTTEGISLDDAVRRLKGEPDTKVSLTVMHARDRRRQTVTIERKIIEVETVLGDKRNSDDQWDFMLDSDKKIGYVRLTAFSRNTASDLENALKELKKRDVKGLVIDLRFNPGGLLRSAIDVADLFIADGRIVSTKGRNTVERPVEARKSGTFEGFEVAVLVNRYSASASEIVSACLQDHKRAVVVGERTWGKGSVQNVIELEQGQSALKLTTAAYMRPSGKNIHRFPNAKETDEWGVMPDKGYEQKLNDSEMSELVRVRRQRDLLLESHSPAVLRESKKDKTDEGDSKNDETKVDPKKEASKPLRVPPGAQSPSDPKTPAEFVDRQLKKAIDYLTAKQATEQAKAEAPKGE
jgi:carboxyl-terminal processing protease